MFVPNGFVPSSAARQTYYDEEGRLRVVNISRDSVGGIGESNSLFATDSEMFGAIAPFIKRNKSKDAPRRNYVIQPGGACIYFDPEKLLADPYDHGRVQFTGPSSRESFGHNSMDGSKMVQGRPMMQGNVASQHER